MTTNYTPHTTCPFMFKTTGDLRQHAIAFAQLNVTVKPQLKQIASLGLFSRQPAAIATKYTKLFPKVFF